MIKINLFLKIIIWKNIIKDMIDYLEFIFLKTFKGIFFIKRMIRKII